MLGASCETGMPMAIGSTGCPGIEPGRPRRASSYADRFSTALGAPSHDGPQRASAGERTPRPPRLRTCGDDVLQVGQLATERLLQEEEERAEGLVLGGGAHSDSRGEVREEA